MKKKLNPTIVYVLSIIGLLCCCAGGLGVLLSAPAYFIANNKIKDAQLNPEEYEGDINAMNTAKTLALVVTIICAVTLIYNIYDLATGGWEDKQKIIESLMQGFNEGYQ